MARALGKLPQENRKWSVDYSKPMSAYEYYKHDAAGKRRVEAGAEQSEEPASKRGSGAGERRVEPGAERSEGPASKEDRAPRKRREGS
jgi:hypothetical protein